MKAVRFYKKQDIRIEQVAEPANPQGEQVLVKPLVCGICGTDLHEYTSGPIVTCTQPHRYTGAGLPQILGHEFSAEVVEVGNQIENLVTGDRVSVQPLVFPREDFYARRGLGHLSQDLGCIGLSWQWGGMAELAIVNNYNAVKIPDSMSNEQGAMIEPAAVAIYGVDRAKLQLGSSVFISGLGPIGALTLLAARVHGVGQIFIAETNLSRLNQAKKLVPEAIAINPLTDNLDEAIRDYSEQGLGVDVAFECAGLEVSLNACIHSVKKQGKVVQVGLHTKPASIDAMLLALKDITFEATWCYPVYMWERVARLIETGNFPLEKLVTGIIDAEDVVSKGFQSLTDPSGENMKILVKM